ncbi:MAG: rRNA maturation RNase YbeY [Bacteroidota bacterium]
MPVIVTNAHPRLRFPVKDSERIVRSVLRNEGTRASSLEIIFVDHRRTIILNKKYLRHNRTTDVIAFCYEREPTIDGEIFVNLDQAKAQSLFYGARFREEVARLLIHGVLHLVGYDDMSMKERNAMKQREDFYLHTLSVCRRKRII